MNDLLQKLLAQAKNDQAVAASLGRKISRCPCCFSEAAPQWRERSPSGNSRCSQCLQMTPNERWNFDKGLTLSQVDSYARTALPQSARAVELVVKALMKVIAIETKRGEHSPGGLSEMVLQEVDRILAPLTQGE